jgi:gluconokinase
VRFVWLRGTPELVTARMAARKGHFMPTSLIGSQFATLEEPRDAIAVDIDGTPEEIAARALEALRAAGRVTPAAGP